MGSQPHPQEDERHADAAPEARRERRALERRIRKLAGHVDGGVIFIRFGPNPFKQR